MEQQIEFVPVEKKDRKYVRDVKVIPWELKHRLVVEDLDKDFKKDSEKKWIIRRMWKLNENRTRVRVKELVSTDLTICEKLSRMDF